MKILVDMGHPAHVHFFKNMIWKLEERGHEIKITARKKDVTLDLLDAYGFKYYVRGAIKTKLAHKALDMLKTDYRIYKFAKEFKPDILLGVHNPYIAQVGWAMRKPSITFTDSEPVPIANLLTFPATNVICTPMCFKKDLGSKQIRFNGYKELAYLHKNYFEPNPAVLDDMGLDEDEDFTLLRFVSWEASHDIGQNGFNLETKQKLVKELEKHCAVFITSETRLPSEFEKYRITLPPYKLHSVLYYATTFVGDTQTMTTEAAILDTPAIRSNSFVGENDMGNFVELEQRYGLIFNYREPKKAIEKAVDLIQQPDLKQKWQEKIEKLLKDKIDVTAFMTWFIENYPESFQIMKENPDYQERFK